MRRARGKPRRAYAEYPSSAETDPTVPSGGPNRVLRGCAFDDLARYCRAANRDSIYPGNRLNDLGFRPARSASP